VAGTEPSDIQRNRPAAPRHHADATGDSQAPCSELLVRALSSQPLSPSPEPCSQPDTTTGFQVKSLDEPHDLEDCSAAQPVPAAGSASMVYRAGARQSLPAFSQPPVSAPGASPQTASEAVLRPAAHNRTVTPRPAMIERARTPLQARVSSGRPAAAPPPGMADTPAKPASDLAQPGPGAQPERKGEQTIPSTGSGSFMASREPRTEVMPVAVEDPASAVAAAPAVTVAPAATVAAAATMAPALAIHPSTEPVPGPLAPGANGSGLRSKARPTQEAAIDNGSSAAPAAPSYPTVSILPPAAVPSAKPVATGPVRQSAPKAAEPPRGLSPWQGSGRQSLNDARVSSDDAGTPLTQKESDNQLPTVSAQPAATSDSDNAELAFGGRLVPAVTADEPARSGRTGPPSWMTDRQSRTYSTSPDSADPPQEKAVSAVAAPSKSSPWNEESPATPPGEKLSLDKRERQTAVSSDDSTPTRGNAAALEVPQVTHPSGPVVHDAPRREPPTAERAASGTEFEPPKAPSANRDIKLEVTSGEQRVELHLAERAGDVHVAVRTPDSHLAVELRENLPALSSRLEQTGLRPEEWHTPSTAVSGEWLRQSEHSSAAAEGGFHGQSWQDAHQQQHGNPQQRSPQSPEEQPHRKQKGKEFSWFMSPQP